MKSIVVQQSYVELKALYEQSVGSKALRGLFGYMLWTGRPNNVVLGGAFRLVQDLERVPHDEMYSLRRIGGDETKEIIAIAEVAMAGGFNRFAISARELRKTGYALRNIELT